MMLCLVVLAVFCLLSSSEDIIVEVINFKLLRFNVYMSFAYRTGCGKVFCTNCCPKRKQYEELRFCEICLQSSNDLEVGPGLSMVEHSYAGKNLTPHTIFYSNGLTSQLPV
jgi:hypothetical protein